MLKALENFLMDLIYCKPDGVQLQSKRDFKNGIELKLPPLLFELVSVELSQEMDSIPSNILLLPEKSQEDPDKRSPQFITYNMSNGVTFKIIEDI